MTRHARRGVDSAGLFAGHAVGQQDAIVAANDQHRVGNRVNHRLQKGPRPANRLLHALSLGNVGDRGLAEGLRAWTHNRNTAKLHGDRPAVVRDQTQLGSHFLALACASSQMIQENLLVLIGHVVAQRVARQFVAVNAQQLGPRQIDLLDVAILVQGGVSQRGEIVQVDVTVPIGFQLPVRPAQILVLLLQFAAAAFKFIDQTAQPLPATEIEGP